jgi:nucleotide-binding universal stress UspA family protein
MTKVLVGYKLSPEGDAALEVGIAEARLRGAELLVIHSSRGGDAERTEDVAALDSAAAAARARLDTEGVPYRFREQVLGNSPSEDIIALAMEEDADVIVIGIRNRSLVGKAILGSTAHEILVGAPCPVISVKAPNPIKEGGTAT